VFFKTGVLGEQVGILVLEDGLGSGSVDFHVTDGQACLVDVCVFGGTVLFYSDGASGQGRVTDYAIPVSIFAT